MSYLLTLLAFHTADPGDHFREAATQFGNAGSALMAPFNGAQPSGVSPMVGIVIALVAVLLLSGGGKKVTAGAKKATGGISPMVLIALAVVGYFVFFGGGLSALGL